jgi:hypothetical protein
MNVGSGAASVILSRGTVNGGVMHKGTGDLSFTMQTNSRVDMYASFNSTGAGRTTLALNSGSSVGKFVSVTAGSGSDALNVNNATIGANFAATLGAGADVMTLSGATIRGGVSLTGSGTDTLSLVSGTTVATTLNVTTTGAAPANISLTSGAVVSGAGTIVTGSGNDVVQVNNASVLGLLTVKAGGGTLNTLTFDNARLGGLFHQGSAAAERITINHGSRLTQYASFNAGGSAAFDIILDGSTVGTFLSVVGGAAADRLALVGATVGNSAASTAGAFALGGGRSDVSIQTSRLTGSLSVTATGPDDNFLLASSLVAGDLSLGFGGASGIVNAAITGSDVGRTLTFQSGGGADFLKVVSSSIGGAANLQTGAGADALTFEGTRFYDRLTINTGAGNDTLSVEFGTSINQTSTIFRGAFAFSGDADNDTVHLGLGDDDLAAFFAAVSLDGGTGGDTLDQAFARYYGGTPTINSF